MSQRVPHDGCRAVDFATADNVSAPTISINAMTNATIFLTFILTFRDFLHRSTVALHPTHLILRLASL